MRRAATVLGLLGAGAAAAGALDCPTCAPAPFAFTLRGGDSDDLNLTRFTPRLGTGARGLAATVDAGAVDLGGYLLPPRPGTQAGAFGFGALVGIGDVSVSGGLKLGAEEGAELGVTWRAAPGLSLGGGLGVTAPDADAPEGGVAAGVTLGLDF